MSLCQYKDVLGKPDEGVHKHVAGFAIGDVIGTLFIAAIIGQTPRETFHWFIWFFTLGQLLHWLFCVDTAFLRTFGLTREEH